MAAEPELNANAQDNHAVGDGATSSVHWTQDEMCEAYVTLGRLSHVRARHNESIELITQAFANTGAASALESAMEKVRGEYKALKQKLEKLYRASMTDLLKHKMVMEGPTRARVELLQGQQEAVDSAEHKIKTLLANPDRSVMLRELPGAMLRASKTLRSSIKLIGLPLPEMRPAATEDFPPGRLQHVVIAPKRLGGAIDGGHDSSERKTTKQRGQARKRNQHPPQRNRQKEDVEEEVPQQQQQQQQQQRSDIPQRSSSPPFSVEGTDSCFSYESSREPVGAASLPAEGSGTSATASPTPVALDATEKPQREDGKGQEAAPATAPARGGHRKRKGRRAPSGWDEEEKGEEREGGGDAALVAQAEACIHCACACRADDVWAAYKTLRKRYRALKDHADKEELRIGLEELRRELQAEMEKQKLEMKATFDKRNSEVGAQLEKKKIQMQAELDGYKRELAASAPAVAGAAAAAAAAPAAASQMEVQSLRATLRQSLKESQAVRQEINDLREKVAFGGEELREELQNGFSLREEISRRRHHGEALLARIRFLQGQTAAQVENAYAVVGREENPGFTGVTATCDTPEHDPSSNSGTPDIDKIARRNRTVAGHRPYPHLRAGPQRLEESSCNVSGGALGRSSFPRHPEGVGHGEDERMSSSKELSTVRATAGGASGRRSLTGIDGRPVAGSWTGSQPDGGQNEARDLERERDKLTREVYELTVRLNTSGVTDCSSSKFEASEPDEDFHDGGSSTTTSASILTGASRPRTSRRTKTSVKSAASTAAAKSDPRAVTSENISRLGGTSRRHRIDEESDDQVSYHGGNGEVWLHQRRTGRDIREIGCNEHQSYGDVPVVPERSRPSVGVSPDSECTFTSSNGESIGNSSVKTGTSTSRRSRSLADMRRRRRSSFDVECSSEQ